MISIQSNIDSLVAQQNLNLDNQFQSNTIQQLTSGYRINKSGDDAAGLAVANGIQSQISQLTQGVNNANNGVSQLQIVDGGLSNISTILNRLQTLATESASATFTGNRSTLNQEYSGLLSEVDRQASNINLASGGSFNSNLSVFIGGGSDTANSTVSVNLGGANNAVDSLSLGLADTNVLGGGTAFTGNTVNLNSGSFLSGTTTESFEVNAVVNGTASSQKLTVTGSSTGISGTAVLGQLNQQLGALGLGVVASQNGTGQLTFSGTNAFNVTDLGGATGTVAAPVAGALTTVTGSAASNATNYVTNGLTAGDTANPAAETLTFQQNGTTTTVALTAAQEALTQTAQANLINAATAQSGIFATVNTAGTGLDFQSTDNFTVSSTGGATGVLGVAAGVNVSPTQTPSATQTSTSNANAAITAINAAIQKLGLTQGVVGAGENTLNYAINLAQSQITNFSSAQSNIKDADVATQAANLSKSQVLTQTAVAALAQANAEPQAILKLLQ